MAQKELSRMPATTEGRVTITLGVELRDLVTAHCEDKGIDLTDFFVRYAAKKVDRPDLAKRKGRGRPKKTASGVD